MAKYIHNVSGGTKTYRGREVLDDAYLLIPDNESSQYSSDSTLISDIVSGDAKMSRDGSSEVTGDYVQQLAFLQSGASLDSEGVPLSRIKLTNSGWNIQVFSFEFTTSKITVDSCIDIDGADLGFVTVKCYDSNDDEITDQGDADTDAVKTVVDWMPDYDYEIMGADLRQSAPPATDIRLFCIGVPDYTKEQGGSKLFVNGGINLKYLGTNNSFQVDGKTPKQLSYNGGIGTNKIRIVIHHGAGVSHSAMFSWVIFVE